MGSHLGLELAQRRTPALGGTMSTSPLQTILEKLKAGEAQAVEQAFLAFEPYLRMVVRRQLTPQLRTRFDSVDIVQSAWLHVLQSSGRQDWDFANEDLFRAFLVRVARNRLIDRARQEKARINREQSRAMQEQRRQESQPRPSEVVQTEELWERMLSLCPPQHREILVLKRQGLTLAAIADRTNLHPSSVRRILYDLARQLTLNAC